MMIKMRKPSLDKIILLGLISISIFLLISATYTRPSLGETIPPGQEKEDQKQPRYAPGEVLVRFREGAEPQSVLKEAHIATESIGRTHSIKPVINRYKKDLKLERDSDGWYWFLGKQYKEPEDISDEELFQEAYQKMSPAEKPIYRTYKIKLPEGMIVEQAVAILEEHPDVEYAQPNYLRELFMVPNDPYYHSSRSWGQSYSDLWGIKKIVCQGAWDISQGDDIVVAVIDTGIDYNHQDLSANIWVNEDEIPGNGVDDDGNGFIDDSRGWDFSDDDNDPSDYYGHGSHVAGTIAAVGNNATGVIGVAPNAKIMAVKIFPWAFDSVCAQGIIYAASNNARVLSNSWGGEGSSRLIEDAIDYAYERGCVVVAAAGNDNADVGDFCPAGYYRTIAVSAFNQDDEKCSFSNYGDKIDVAAPGGGYSYEPSYGEYNILSTMPDVCGIAEEAPVLKVSNGYWRLAGTSMACPHVSGVAALILGINPSLTNNEVRQVLRSTADDVGSPGFDIYSGYGRVNAYNAVMTQATCEAEIGSASIRSGSVSVVDVSYRAAGLGLSFYILDYSTDQAPGSWTEITSGVTAVEDGSASFTLPAGSGTATIRLRVTSIAGTIYEDNRTLEYETIKISSPLNGAMITDAEVNVLGNAAGSDFSSYTLECSSLGIVNGPVTAQVVNGVLGAIDGSLLEEDVTYTLTLRITTTGGEKTAQLNFSVVKGMLTNWPVSFTYEYGGTLYRPIVTTAPTIADIDGDGYAEVIAVGYLGTDPGDAIGVYRYNGTSQTASWPRHIDGALLHRDKVVLGDLDGDDRMEIIAATKTGSGDNAGRVFAWNQNGGILPGWPQSYTGDLKGLSLADIDRDANLDIVVTTLAAKSARIEVWNAAGGNIAGWPVSVSLPSESADFLEGAVAGDIIGDRFKELIVALSSGNTEVDSRLAVLDYQGNQILDQPVSGISKLYSPVLGDLDNDGYAEVIVAATTSDSSAGSLYIFQADGTQVQGWPREAGIRPCHISLADFDSNGYPEIIVGTDFDLASQENSITVFDYLGNRRPGWPVSFEPGNIGMRQDPIIGDIDGDGGLEIMAIQQYYISEPLPHYELRLHAWDDNGASLGGYPKVLSAEATFSGNGGSPSIADLNQDGLVDIVVPKGDHGHIYAYSLSAAFDENNLVWPVYRHDAQHTACLPSRQGNHPPFLYHIGGRSVDEGQLLEFIVVAYDYDGDALAYSADHTIEGATFSSQTFRWTPNYTQSGIYSVTFNVSDAEFTASETITITVNNVNHPPVLDSIGDRTVDENNLLEFIVSASDINGDALTYSAENLPNGATFTEQTFSWRPTYEQSGTYSVRFNVSDGELTDSETIAITVNNVNRPPVLDSIGNSVVDENSLLGFAISASDPDGDSLTYSAENLPSGATFTERTFSWRPTYEQAGSYLVTFSVSDGEARDSETVTITVNNVNRAPVLNFTGNKAVGINGLLSFIVSGSDPDGDAVTYSVQNLPGRATFGDQNFSWRPTYEQIGSYSVTFVISDGTLTDSETITITVREVNHPPAFNPTADKTVYEENLLEFTVSASDPDGDYIKYSAQNLPEGATFGNQTFGWTPTSAQAGGYSVTFSASDGELSDSMTVNVTVTSLTPVSEESGLEDSSSADDSSDSEDSESVTSYGGWFVPVYSQDTAAKGALSSTQSRSEPGAGQSEETRESSLETGAGEQGSLREDFGDGVLEEVAARYAEIAEQIDFMRRAGFKDESAIEMIRDGIVSFDYFIYSADKDHCYIGNQPYENYAQMAKGIVRQGKQPADFYYAQPLIKSKVFRAYTSFVNGVATHEVKKAPNEPSVEILQAAKVETPTPTETNQITEVADDIPVTIETPGQEKPTAYSKFIQWLRNVTDKIRTRVASLFRNKK